jgi:alginate O-acetyltransferase complex protein AlgI
MVFTEEVFLFYFLPLVLLVYYILPYDKEPKPGRSRYFYRNLWLTLSGYFFYAWFEPWFVFVMMFTNVFDFFCGRFLGRSAEAAKSDASLALRRKLVMITSMCVNLGLLAYFKYGIFTQVNLNHILETFGQANFQIYRIVFPIGISFYTFHSMSYVIDIYRGERPVYSFFDFSCFVSLFPQLVAGPILRYNVLQEQFHSRQHSLELFCKGVLLFCLGFAMKVMLANPVGQVADAAFESASPHTFDAWWGLWAYALQIYFDFNGYSVMAMGLGHMFGFNLLRNFNAPYKSESITDFWRRWHISLSTWLREYLYISLGGNRKGETRTYINLALVMLLGGLWHGAQWQFLVWGAIHGVFLGIERWAGKKPFYGALPHQVRVAVTLFIVLIAWVFFRADDLTHAVHYVGRLFGAGTADAHAGMLGARLYHPFAFAAMALSTFFVWQPLQAQDFGQRISWGRFATAFALFIIGVLMMYTQAFNPFLYFQF